MSLLTSLISYWKLDEASGNAIDSHGSNTLNQLNSVGSATGKINNGRDFENDQTSTVTDSAACFFLADTASLDVTNQDFTWSVWVNMESKSGYSVILQKQNTTGPIAQTDFSYYLLYDFLADRFRYSLSNGAVVADLVANTLGSPSTGTWYHIVIWYDSVADQMGMKVNNVSETPTSYSGGGYDTADQFMIGSQANRVQLVSMDGIIDEVGFWKDRVLSAGDITDLYNSGNALPYSSFGGESSEIISARQLISVP